MCAKKNALWGKILEASGSKLSDALPSPDFAMESGGYGYETAMGRASWPSPDPIGKRGGVNLYGMVGNDVVNVWDYLGLTNKDCCCTVTVVIELPGNDPGKLNRKGMSGHSGQGIDGDYYDYGPQDGQGGNVFGSGGQPWWDKSPSNPDRSLDDIRRDEYPEHKQPIFEISIKVPKEKCDELRAYWEILYRNPGTYRFYGRQCTTAVCRGLRESGISDVNAIKPSTLLKKIQKEKHQCGPKNGQPVDVKRVQ